MSAAAKASPLQRPVGVGDDPPPLRERVAAVAAVARAHAVEVDQEARLPVEAIGALREHRLLGPGPRPGRSWSGRGLVAVAESLGAACSSTGLIWAMHQGQLATLCRHGGPGPLGAAAAGSWADQPLVASVVSERGAGDPRQGVAHLEPSDVGWVEVRKQASATSYLEVADLALIAVRRGAHAPPADQVLVLARRDQAELTFGQRWDALGMRGTGSGSAEVHCRVPVEQIFAEPFGTLSAVTMNPVTHLAWGGCWAGIAADAVQLARRHLRLSMSRMDPQLAAVKAVRLGDLVRTLAQVRSVLTSFADQLDARAGDGGAQAPLDLSLALDTNFVRLSAAELTVRVALGALELIGLDAYRTGAGAPSSLSRHLRDLMSALVMVGSDRLRLADGLMALPGSGVPNADLDDEDPR